jgi:predicted N-formylglutamate amidohydrolase
VPVLSCEHGGNEVPPAYRRLFAGRSPLLESHRGWDPGTLELGVALARRLSIPLVVTTVTRLLVDTNRSLGHHQLFSEISQRLGETDRDTVLEHYYFPHRRRVAEAVDRGLESGARVLHIGVHSFTPVLDGDERRFDIGWLYDPRRRAERAVADRLRAALALRRPDLRQRRNAPYLGRADGLTTSLRKRHGEASYLGIELEINQLHPTGRSAAWRRLIEDLCDAIGEVVDTSLVDASMVADGGKGARATLLR